MNKNLLLIGLSFLSLSAHAEVKPQMDEMLGYIYELKPYISNEAEYTDPKNAATIQETLRKMTVLSEKIQHDDKIKDSPKSVSAMSLHEQFKDAADIFSFGSKSYSLWVLRSNLNNCMACHTQLPARSTTFNTGAKKDYLTNSFREAEFLFVVRNFDKAIELYNKSIAEFPGNKLNPQTLETALTRKVYYFTRVQRDLKGLSSSLNKDLKNKKLPERIAAKIKSYSEAALKLAGEKVPAMTTEEEVRTYAEKVLARDLKGDFDYEDSLQNLRRLQLSGFLYEFLDKKPDSSLRPHIYYWLSFCESRWEKGPQSSLPESYLQKCINQFPQSDVAPLCYKEYEDLITFGYTGSSGTHIPPEVKKKLDEMKQKIKLKK